MQKRRIGAMGGFLLAGAVLLSGCSSPVGGETGVAQKLSGSFTTEMTMNMEEQTVSGTLSRMATACGASALQSRRRWLGWCWTFPAVR